MAAVTATRALHSRKIIHVDMDAFYASVEQRDDPSISGKPVVVGGDPNTRGVVAAASYEARQFGIHSAMPMKTAMRLCPAAIRVSPNFDKYQSISRQLHQIFNQFTDLYEPLALDEAYLDVTYNKLDIPFGSRVAKMIKAQIRSELGLTASAGVAPNKFLAKLASDHDKPNGLVVIMPDETVSFLADLSVTKIPGVGKVTAERLERMDILTAGGLAQRSPQDLTSHFGRRGAYLWQLANGIDDEPVVVEREPKQLSQESTFSVDVHDIGEMRTTLRELAEEVSNRLRRQRLRGRVVTVKVRYPNFQTQTRSRTLPRAVDDLATILCQAVDLLDRTDVADRGARLLGVGVAAFETENEKQLDLFGGRTDYEEPTSGSASPNHRWEGPEP